MLTVFNRFGALLTRRGSAMDKASDLGKVSGRVLDLRTTTLQNREAVPRKARSQGSWKFASLNASLERNQEERRTAAPRVGGPTATWNL